MFRIESIGTYLNVLHGNHKSRLTLDYSVQEQIKKHFYVLSITTTGLKKNEDVVISIDLVEYKNKQAINYFQTEVTKENLEESLKQLAIVMKGSLEARYPVYITNSTFELDVLLANFEKYGISYHIRFLDLISLNRKYIQDLDSFKLRYQRLKKQDHHSYAKLIGNLIIELIED